MLGSKGKTISVQPLKSKTTSKDDDEAKRHGIEEISQQTTPKSIHPKSKHKRPSQAYLQSAKSNSHLTKELRKQTSEFVYPVIITNESFMARIKRIGWKTILITFFLLAFSLGILIGTFASINKLPKQGFYLFLVVGLVVFIPACYAVYTVLGKFFEW